jgi:NAD(P)-dependent dehydrogenase (short-subunit alcohol dehydrogenase family)/acyl carrier protein
LVVHAASPAVHAPIEQLVGVNFIALKQMINAALPALLARQHGSVIAIGSRAIELPLPGWEAYAGAKVMATHLVSGFDQAHSRYGVRGLTLAPDFVATEFSKPYRSASDPALLPQEVADAVLQLLADHVAAGSLVMLDPGRTRRGQFGFLVDRANRPSPDHAFVEPQEDKHERQVHENAFGNASLISPVMRRVLGLPEDYSLANAALGHTPAWDSLKHIELILGIEAALGIHFDASEIEGAHRFDEIDAICRKKLADARLK